MRQFVRVYQRPDGSVNLVYPSWDDGLSGFGKTAHTTEQEWYDWAVSHGQPPEYVRVADVEMTSLPSREFRACWRANGQAIQVDPDLEMVERWRRIRVERNRRLMESDGLMARANELGISVDVWKAYRQALRDVPTQPDPKAIVWPNTPA